MQQILSEHGSFSSKITKHGEEKHEPSRNLNSSPASNSGQTQQTSIFTVEKDCYQFEI